MTSSSSSDVPSLSSGEFRADRNLCIQSPFLVALVSGKLDLAVFNNFISQEIILRKFIAETLLVVQKAFVDDTHFNFDNELIPNILISESYLFKELGLNSDSLREYPENIATSSYKKFLASVSGVGVGQLLSEEGEELESAYKYPGGVNVAAAGFILGVVAPHLDMCAFIGELMGNKWLNPKETCHAYKSWIDFTKLYARGAAIYVEKWMERIHSSMTTNDRLRLKEIYGSALKHELQFFSAQQPMKTDVPLLFDGFPSCRRQMIVVSSFDTLCTTSQSQLCSVNKCVSGDEDSDLHEFSLKRHWRLIIKEGGFKLEDLRKAVVDTDLEEKIEKETMDLCDTLCTGILSNKYSINLLKHMGQPESLNARFHVVFHGHHKLVVKEAIKKAGLDNLLEVHENEHTYKVLMKPSEELVYVESINHKLKVLEDIILRSRLASEKDVFVVYVGSTVGDLLCLLKADLGIVVGSDYDLRSLGDQGIMFVPLHNILLKRYKDNVAEDDEDKWKKVPGVLFTVSTWTDIFSCVIGGRLENLNTICEEDDKCPNIGEETEKQLEDHADEIDKAVAENN